jgi:hypothetical protein
MTYNPNIRCWGPNDRNGRVIKRADTVIVYRPNGSTDTIWLSALVSNVQTNPEMVCVLCGDGNYHHFAPEDIYVIESSESTGTNESSLVRTKAEKPKQWENYRLPRRSDSVYHPGLGEVVYVVKRVKSDVVLRRINDSGRLMREHMEANVSEIYPIQRCYYKDGRWRPIK